MIPTYVKKHGNIEPPANTHYILAKNGVFLHKKMWWIDAIVEIADTSDLIREIPSAKLLLPKLPLEIMAKALKVAKAVYDLSRSEVCLPLHYHKGTGYQLTLPEQIVSPSGVSYDASLRLPDAILVGTIHSHGDFPAGHSNIDLEDEEKTDGVHITVGNIDLYPAFSLSAEIAVNGNRFPVDLSWFEGLIPDGEIFRIEESVLRACDIPEDWLRAIDHADLRLREPKKEEKQ